MTGKIKLFGAARDGQDGSYSVELFNTRQEALNELDRTEEELSNGCFHEDGGIAEVVIELVDGKLKKPVYISLGDQ